MCAVIFDRRDTGPAPPFSTAVNNEDVTIAGGSAALAFDLSSSSLIVTDWVTATATLLVGGLPSETSQFSFGIRVTA